jgi:hypothetical protein
MIDRLQRYADVSLSAVAGKKHCGYRQLRRRRVGMGGDKLCEMEIEIGASGHFFFVDHRKAIGAIDGRTSVMKPEKILFLQNEKVKPL